MFRDFSYHLSVTDFQFDAIVAGEFALHGFNSFKFGEGFFLFYGPGYGPLWYMFYGHLKRVCILLLLGVLLMSVSYLCL